MVAAAPAPAADARKRDEPVVLDADALTISRWW